MPYLFTCPHCQTQTLVDDQFSGHVGLCVTCNQSIEVPQFLASAAEAYRPVPGTRTSLGPNSRRLIAAAIGVIILAGAIGVAFRYGSPVVARLSATRVQGVAIRNLEQIASALNAYAADYGTYPLPIVRDANGRAMHSWRVAILPYLNEHDLYKQYDFNKPWDDPENLVVAESAPRVYTGTNQGVWTGAQCYYHLVTGDRTIFPKSGPLSPKRINDDPAKTALVVEGMSKFSSTSAWTEPTELDFQSMTGAIGQNPGTEIGSVTEGGAAIATVDGLGHFLEESMPQDIVLAILTASGGEPLADDVLD
jgi:hypothetical protein